MLLFLKCPNLFLRKNPPDLSFRTIHSIRRRLKERFWSGRERLLIMSRKKEGKNLKLAGLFVLLVLGLIILSLLLKVFFIFKNSKFDAEHRFVVAVMNNGKLNMVSFSPQNKSISILKVENKIKRDDISKTLEVPVDAIIESKQELNKNNVSNILLKTFLPFGNSVNKLNIVDAFRLFLFSRGVPLNSVYQREFSNELNDAQKETILSLTFTDPTIYQENLSIQVINATNVSGLGTRLANFITNIGGNVILVSTQDKESKMSKIIYYQKPSYTVTKLSSYFGFPLEKSEQKEVSDVIIIIGTDKISSNKF